MNKAAAYYPDHRLVHLLSRPGGLSAEKAISRATARLAGIRGACVAALNDKIEMLAGVARRGAPTRGALLPAASEIYAIAALFGVNDVAHAAGSLCDLLLLGEDRAVGTRPSQTPAGETEFLGAILVHVEALRRLRRPEAGPSAEAEGAAIIRGLRKVTGKFISPETARDEDLCDARVTELESAVLVGA